MSVIATIPIVLVATQWYYDIVPFGNSVCATCKICSESFDHLKRLSIHIKIVHKLTPQVYTIVHHYDGVEPKCLHCKLVPTRYASLGVYKKYCPACAVKLSSAHGKIGGKAEAWNKGKTKETDDRVAKIAQSFLGENNPFWGKRHSDVTIASLSKRKTTHFKQVLEEITSLHPNVHVSTSAEEYENQRSPLQLKCVTCGTSYEQTALQLKRTWRCKVCEPFGSRPQIEIFKYVQSLCPSEQMLSSTRDVIPPLELDIYVPGKQLAIEYHGLYWHSNPSDDKKKHRLKYERCKREGVKLIQIFGDEWRDKQEIIKSMIAHSIGAQSRKIGARKTQFITLSSKETKPFLEANHVSGSTRASYHYGLTYDNELVAVATFRKPIQKKWGDVLELARMAFLVGTSIPGGASKLLRGAENILSSVSKGFLSYAELRFGEGTVYGSCGFSRQADSPINYWYTDGSNRFDRFKYRARPPKTEREVAEECGVRPIWGCGNAIWTKSFT